MVVMFSLAGRHKEAIELLYQDVDKRDVLHGVQMLQKLAELVSGLLIMRDLCVCSHPPMCHRSDHHYWATCMQVTQALPERGVRKPCNVDQSTCRRASIVADIRSAGCHARRLAGSWVPSQQ
jgi:hypothetical protein